MPDSIDTTSDLWRKKRVEVIVNKAGHRVVITSRGRFLLLDHDKHSLAKERAIWILGGEPCRCVQILDQWRSYCKSSTFAWPAELAVARRNLIYGAATSRAWRRYLKTAQPCRLPHSNANDDFDLRFPLLEKIVRILYCRLRHMGFPVYWTARSKLDHPNFTQLEIWFEEFTKEPYVFHFSLGGQMNQITIGYATDTWLTHTAEGFPVDEVVNRISWILFNELLERRKQECQDRSERSTVWLASWPVHSSVDYNSRQLEVRLTDGNARAPLPEISGLIVWFVDRAMRYDNLKKEALCRTTDRCPTG